MIFLFSADFFFIFKNSHRNTISVKQFETMTGLPVFRPDLGPNCLQKLSVDKTSWQRVNFGNIRNMYIGQMRPEQLK